MTIPSITIDNGHVACHNITGTIMMTQHEIADLFGVFVPAISSNIRSIFKSEVLDASRVRRIVRHLNGNTTTLYNLEMITALAFRLKSPKAEVFRRWIVEQAVSTPASSSMLWQIQSTDATVN